jgi:hypothetical protein
MDIRKNPWLKDANRRSIVHVHISSLNLHGTGKRSGIVKRSEVFTTMFKMEMRLGRRNVSRDSTGLHQGYTWTQARTFDEFKMFYERLLIAGGANAKEKLTVTHRCIALHCTRAMACSSLPSCVDITFLVSSVIGMAGTASSPCTPTSLPSTCV